MSCMTSNDCSSEAVVSMEAMVPVLRECSSTLYVGLPHTAPSTNTVNGGGGA